MASWKNWLPGTAADWQLRPSPAGVETARRQLLAVLDDCDGVDCDRLRWRVHTAECAQELWLLRDAVFQAVASQHCQAAAVERINGLLPAFERLLPAAPLHRV
jgi:hypothetical protein